jgi:hypothetical protein
LEEEIGATAVGSWRRSLSSRKGERASALGVLPERVRGRVARVWREGWRVVAAADVLFVE